MKIGPVHIYAHHLGDYMRRWIVATPIGTLRVHHILRSDVDPELHDHPWDFVSLILAGGYREIVRRGNDWPGGPSDVDVLHRPPGSLNFCPATRAHRVELDRPAWTLVLSGPRIREWGFWTAKGWVPWRTFVSRKAYDRDAYAAKVEQVTA